MKTHFSEREVHDDLEKRYQKGIPTEIEPSPEYLPAVQKFNWIALFVMLISIGVVLAVGFFIPGLLDEYIAIVIINIIYGFVQANGLKTPKK